MNNGLQTSLLWHKCLVVDALVNFHDMTAHTIIDTPHELNSRERLILQAVVHNFILHATPVGSRNLSKYLQDELHLSPATIRNAMADLEEQGYIGQPHTSAGRVPTDKGYRYYVDSLMNIEELSEHEVGVIKDNLNIARQQEVVLRDTSRLLGSLSHYLSIVRMPQILNAVVGKIELFVLASHRLLAVLTLNSDLIRTLSLEVKFNIVPGYVEDVQRLLNERLSGKTLQFIRENLEVVVQDAMVGEPDARQTLLRVIIDSAEQLFSNEYTPGGTLHIAGAQHLFDYPEFGSAERVRTIIELIESEEIIIHLLDNHPCEEGKVNISIGSEIESSLMGEYSLLTTKYRYASADAVGTIGLIGPKRMHYSRMISIVHHVASILSER